VRVQASNLRWTAVDMGLDPEDKVIVGPYRAVLQLTDGKKVRVLKPEGEEPADAAGVAAEGEAEPAKAEGDASSDTGAAAASTNG
jgi:hypothetical protein